jgi:hypothetical protein
MRTVSIFSILSASAAALAAQKWPHLCTTAHANYSSFNETRCPPFATCAPNEFSLSGFGCAPFINATICNGFQSCPALTSCVLSNGNASDPQDDLHAVFDCVEPTTQASWGKSRCSCKPGAPLPPSTTLKNVLIIGDSISIGYTPFVQAALSDVAQVQHAPFSSDGGAEEMAYTLQCAMPYWLSSPSGMKVRWDLIYVNKGMHSTNQGAAWTVPGQSGEPAAYASELASLMMGLVERAAKDGTQLLFALTSPMLCNATVDKIISSHLNPSASALTTALGVPTVDLYAAVVQKCGPVPQASCFDLAGCFCPHCNDAGYAFLANQTIAPSIRRLLDA